MTVPEVYTTVLKFKCMSQIGPMIPMSYHATLYRSLVFIIIVVGSLVFVIIVVGVHRYISMHQHLCKWYNHHLYIGSS
jgi:hypothetical protein